MILHLISSNVKFYLFFVSIGFYHFTAEAFQQPSNPRIIDHPESLYVAEQEPATLNCVAEGEPSPVITWYANGRPVVTANEDPRSHRMVLPSGQLFFLKVTTNKTHKGDVGVYYCNATNPETNVCVISRSATLEIAVLGTEFQLQPKNSEVALGMTAIIECRPPWGEPEPKVKWKKDGEIVKNDRMEIMDSGNLKIKDVRKDDGGIYVCVAFNPGGQRDSLPVRLYVKEKPRIVEGPKDVFVPENSDAIFHCRATGDPEPTIWWKRIDSQMSHRRLVILDDKSLKIERTQISDNGIYACRAENPFGFQESEARLTVHSQPSFIITPRDKTVGVGKRVTFKCSVTGNPTPAVFWNKESSQTLMFPKQDYGRMSVQDDGTLIIENVEKPDAGDYVCKGLSVAGSAYAKARLEVKDYDTRPPPIINHAPQNQTLPANSVATLHCTASGDPPPVIKWFKNGRSLNMKDDRFILHDSGTLQINDLRKPDSGVYMCKAISETGEASKTCNLQVEIHTNPSIIFHRTPEPSTFPGPPSKPSILEVAETSVRLTWRNNPNQGSSPVFAYTVEYFSHETGEGWIVASDSITEQVYVVRGLQPDISYMFLVRAQNSHGLSLPSHVTAPIKTKGSSAPALKPTLSSSELELVADKLSNQIITLFPPDVLGSTSLKMTWEVRRNHRFIEGFHIRYRALPELNDHLVDRKTGKSISQNHSVVTVQGSTTTTYTLNNLEKNTWYEIDIQPYYRDVFGQESNSIRIRTLEDVPSATPQNIKAHMIDNTTLYITWEPPPKEHYNGVLKGYKIYIFGNESKFDREIQINSSLEGVYIQNMIQDMAYKIQMSAYNRMGEGIRSEPILIGPPSSVASQSVVKQTWFIVLIVGIGLLLWAALCIFSIWLYKKKKRCKNTVNGLTEKYSQSNSFNINKRNGFSGVNYSAMPQSNDDLKLTYNPHLATPSYMNPESFPAPTITPSMIKQQYMIEPKNESKSFNKENLSSDSTVDTNLVMDLEEKDLEESQQYERICDDHYKLDQHPALFLPPPPEHPPPPSDTETSVDSMQFNWKGYDNSFSYNAPRHLDYNTNQCTLSRKPPAPYKHNLQSPYKDLEVSSSSIQKKGAYSNGGTNPMNYMLSQNGPRSSSKQSLTSSPHLTNPHLFLKPAGDSIQVQPSLNSPMSEVAVVDSESESDANLSQVGSPLTSDLDALGNWGDDGENSDSFTSMGSSDNECLAQTEYASKAEQIPESFSAGANISDKHLGKEKMKKLIKSKQKNRCFSPCSSDSNYCSISHKTADKRLKNTQTTPNYLKQHLENNHERFVTNAAASQRINRPGVSYGDRLGAISDEPCSSNDSSSCHLLSNTTCT